MVNASKIRARMDLLGVTASELGDILGISHSLASRKLNGLSPMSLDDAEKLQEILKIEDEDFGSYFFA